MLSIDQRVAYVTATSEQYNHKPLVLGSDDCVHMIDFGLRIAGIKTNLNRMGSYSTEAQARRALMKSGYADLKEAVSAQGFVEIAPAMAWPGDIIAMRSEDPDNPGLAFMASGGRAFGFWNGMAQFFQPLEFVTAWRVS